MKGPAGVGKCAAAQTCAEKLEQLGKLGAAFFSSINRHSAGNNISTNGKGEHHKFFPSIAYQLAILNSDYHSLIDRKIHQTKTLLSKSMEAQFWGDLH